MKRFRSLSDKPKLAVVGRPKVFVCTEDPRTQPGHLLFGGTNQVCLGMYDALQNLLMRNFADWQPSGVAVGYGGDYSQPDDPEAEIPADSGARVGPAITDTYVRKEIQTVPIIEVRESPLTLERRLHYIAIVAPDSLVTDIGEPTRPFINELGLVAENGTLLAHYVTEVDAGSGRATRYNKTDLEWLVIDWELELVGGNL